MAPEQLLGEDLTEAGSQLLRSLHFSLTCCSGCLGVCNRPVGDDEREEAVGRSVARVSNAWWLFPVDLV